MTVTPGELVRVALRAPFTRRARREAGYALVGVIPAWTGAVVVTAMLATGVLASVSVIGTFIGLLVLTLTLRLCRRLGSLHRWLARRLLHQELAAPAPFRPSRGILRRVDTRLRDGTAWRALGYLVLKLPVSAL